MRRGLGRTPKGILIFIAFAAVLALAATGGAGAQSIGIEDDNLTPQDQIVQVIVPDRASIDALIAADVDLVEYVRENGDGTLTLNAVVNDEELAALEDAGYQIGETIEDYNNYLARIAERDAALAAEEQSHEAAETGDAIGGASMQAAGLRSTAFAAAAASEITVNRVDYFQNYAGWFLSLEVYDSAVPATGAPSNVGPVVSFAWRTAGGGYGSATTIPRYIDTDPAPDVYMYNRILVRIGPASPPYGAGVAPVPPDMVRVSSSTAGVTPVEAPVRTWVGNPLPAGNVNFSEQYFTAYMDPTQVASKFESLATEFGGPGGIAELITLPEKSSGYQRKSQVVMDPVSARVVVNPPSPAAGSYAFAQGAYGPAVPVAGVSGSFAVVNDGTAIPNEGCSPLIGFPAGAIAVVDRGTCTFVIKTAMAQAAGAVAVIVVNNVAGAPTAPGGTDPTATIPTVMISQADGATLKAGLPATGTMFGTVAVSNTSRVVLTSRAWGQQGGNSVKAQFVNPGVANSPLSVSTAGSEITVSIATNPTGGLTSTAAQVVAAINADPAASALVKALTFQGNAGAGVVPATAKLSLSDFLNAPASVQRGPFTMKALRIGGDVGKAPADSHRVGVYLFCQQHAREWVTPLTCVQTAEMLLRNYATDPHTKELVDNLDIFILPSVNPDGSHYSLYDFASQRKNMTNRCVFGSAEGDDANAADFWTPRLNTATGAPFTATDPGSRNTWGVDLNRNSGEYSLFDGYFGASTSCTSEVFAGPSEVSEPETRNLSYIVDTYSNIKFANNIHTYGGYFMWAPGSYTGNGRISAPPANFGIEAYFFAAADTVLQRIKDVRGTAVLPGRTGPIADVLYSAAGNGADDLWYRKGIIAYSFEAGSDRFSSTTTGTTQSEVGFQPNFANEGRFEALEFAAGNFGLLESALAYERDHTPPVVEMTGGRVSPDPIETTFRWVNEPSVVYYTMDGSTPTFASPVWDRQRLRGPGQNFTIDTTRTVKWLAVDIAGNSSTGQAHFAINDTTDPTISIVSPKTVAAGGDYLIGTLVNADYSCADDDIVVSCVGPVANGSPINTSTVGFHTFTVQAVDFTGNTASATVTYNVHWPFSGLKPPFGKLNSVNAGSTLPLKFSLGGYYGLGIMAAGSPSSEAIPCATAGAAAISAKVPLLTRLTTKSAGQSRSSVRIKKTIRKKKAKAVRAREVLNGTLTFSNGLYQLDWKTNKAWAGTCREVELKFIDNHTYTAYVSFVK